MYFSSAKLVIVINRCNEVHKRGIQAHLDDERSQPQRLFVHGVRSIVHDSCICLLGRFFHRGASAFETVQDEMANLTPEFHRLYKVYERDMMVIERLLEGRVITNSGCQL